MCVSARPKEGAAAPRVCVCSSAHARRRAHGGHRDCVSRGTGSEAASRSCSATMGGPNDSMSSTKGSSKRNPPDEQKWHPGRQLCYHWKREHTYLRDQVDAKTIAFNTQFDLEIEHCEMERMKESMSVRPSTKGASVCARRWVPAHAAPAFLSCRPPRACRGGGC